jgi:hypothetical protein
VGEVLSIPHLQEDWESRLNTPHRREVAPVPVIDPVFDATILGPSVAFLKTIFPMPAAGVGGFTIGTGTLIAPRILLTAGHVVFDPSQGGFITSAQVTFGGLGGRPLPAAHADTTATWAETDSHSNLDFLSVWDLGVLVLAQPVTNIPHVPFKVPPENPDLGARLLATGGYPAYPSELHSGGAGHNRGEICAARFNILPDLGIDIPPELDYLEEARIAYPVNTVRGMSGGPVLFSDGADTGSLVAIHTSTLDTNETLGSAVRLRDELITIVKGWVAKNWDAT